MNQKRCLIVVMLMCVMILSFSISSGAASTDDASATAAEGYAIGETWTVDGQWSLTITGIEETDYRNQYTDKDPSAVYYIDYVYTNLGYTSTSMDGVYFDLDSESIVDANGIVGSSYPGEVTYGPKETPVGATCKAQTCIGVENAGTVSISISKYDGEGVKQNATFIIDPTITYDKDSLIIETVDVDVEGYAIGETWTVDGQWSLTITGIEETDYRNGYTDKTPNAVYYIDYEYTNLGYTSDYMDGLYFDLDSNIIVDSGWIIGSSYPGDITNSPDEAPVGSTCKAQICIGVENAGTVQIYVSKYDGNSDKQTAVFVLDPSAEFDASSLTTDTVEVDVEGYAIGETWTVDGQWSLTITGIEETDYRNEYTDKAPNTVYYISYEYTNLGYTSDYLDGVYFDLDSETIVDAGGTVGASYPGSTTDSPKETPVGATCAAQSCIGVENSGTITIYISKYDGNGDKQTATFIIEP